MSLKPTPIEPIAEQTARIARAAFLNGNSYLTLRDELRTLYRDEDFVGIFSTPSVRFKTRREAAQAPEQIESPYNSNLH